MTDSIFRISSPTRETTPLPLVFDSPHSGRVYPDDFGYACPLAALERAEDNDVDDLFSSVPTMGGTLLCAQFPRCYIDPNRAEDDIDVDMLADRWPTPTNPSARSHAGNGLIRRLVRPGMLVYDRPLPIQAVQHRLDQYYRPYHAQLKKLVDDAHYRYGQVWHVNCHSMPSTLPIFPAQPDFVLGDRDGTSCDLEFTHALRDLLRNLGYKVNVNNPYKGVELVRRHGHPSTGRHSIQIEINKALYWDEENNKRNRNYKRLKADIDTLVHFISNFTEQHLVNFAAD